MKQRLIFEEKLYCLFCWGSLDPKLSKDGPEVNQGFFSYRKMGRWCEFCDEFVEIDEEVRALEPAPLGIQLLHRKFEAIT